MANGPQGQYYADAAQAYLNAAAQDRAMAAKMSATGGGTGVSAFGSLSPGANNTAQTFSSLANTAGQLFNMIQQHDEQQQEAQQQAQAQQEEEAAAQKALEQQEALAQQQAQLAQQQAQLAQDKTQFGSLADLAGGKSDIWSPGPSSGLANLAQGPSSSPTSTSGLSLDGLVPVSTPASAPSTLSLDGVISDSSGSGTSPQPNLSMDSLLTSSPGAASGGASQDNAASGSTPQTSVADGTTVPNGGNSGSGPDQTDVNNTSTTTQAAGGTQGEANTTQLNSEGGGNDSTANTPTTGAMAVNGSSSQNESPDTQTSPQPNDANSSPATGFVNSGNATPTSPATSAATGAGSQQGDSSSEDANNNAVASATSTSSPIATTSGNTSSTASPTAMNTGAQSPAPPNEDSAANPPVTQKPPMSGMDVVWAATTRQYAKESDAYATPLADSGTMFSGLSMAQKGEDFAMDYSKGKAPDDMRLEIDAMRTGMMPLELNDSVPMAKRWVFNPIYENFSILNPNCQQ